MASGLAVGALAFWLGAPFFRNGATPVVVDAGFDRTGLTSMASSLAVSDLPGFVLAARFFANRAGLTSLTCLLAVALLAVCCATLSDSICRDIPCPAGAGVGEGGVTRDVVNCPASAVVIGGRDIGATRDVGGRDGRIFVRGTSE